MLRKLLKRQCRAPRVLITDKLRDEKMFVMHQAGECAWKFDDGNWVYKQQINDSRHVDVFATKKFTSGGVDCLAFKVPRSSDYVNRRARFTLVVWSD